MKSTTTKLMAAAAMSVGMASSAFAAQTPIIGSGYNRDVIADTGATAVASVSGGGVDNQFAYYQRGFVPASPQSGIPTGSTAPSESDPNTVFRFQAAAANNTVYLSTATPSASFTLNAPGRYSTLSFLATGLNAGPAFNYSFNYTTGAPTTGSGTAPDNFGNPNIGLTLNGRVDILSNGPSDVDSGNPRLYQINSTGIDSARALASITLTATNLAGAGPSAATVGQGGTQGIAFFGFSGTAVPEPASLGLLGLGGLTLLRRRRA